MFFSGVYLGYILHFFLQINGWQVRGWIHSRDSRKCFMFVFQTHPQKNISKHKKTLKHGWHLTFFSFVCHFFWHKMTFVRHFFFILALPPRFTRHFRGSFFLLPPFWMTCGGKRVGRICPPKNFEFWNRTLPFLFKGGTKISKRVCHLSAFLELFTWVGTMSFFSRKEKQTCMPIMLLLSKMIP